MQQTIYTRDCHICECMVKKDIEIQSGFEPGSSEFRSDALTNWVSQWNSEDLGSNPGWMSCHHSTQIKYIFQYMNSMKQREWGENWFSSLSAVVQLTPLVSTCNWLAVAVLDEIGERAWPVCCIVHKLTWTFARLHQMTAYFMWS